MKGIHTYSLSVEWTGNTGVGTADAQAYQRSHNINVPGKGVMECSSDPAFRGDKSKYNPEELFLASLSSCHMLWYLHLCADAGIVVVAYSDEPKGVMTEETPHGRGRFTEVTLYPSVTIKDSSLVNKAILLHEAAHQKCFIANSCNFPVGHSPKIMIAE